MKAWRVALKRQHTLNEIDTGGNKWFTTSTTNPSISHRNIKQLIDSTSSQIGRTTFQQQIEEVPSASQAFLSYLAGRCSLPLCCRPFSPLRQNCDDDLCEEMYSPET